MPRKYQQKALLTKPTSGAPSSLSLSRTLCGSNQRSDEKTVNGLIQEARRAHNNGQILYNSQTTSSVPPAIRTVLDIPIPSPPLPRNRLHGPGGLRRTAGPPPPRSWLLNDIHPPSHAADFDNNVAYLRTRTAKQYTKLPGAVFPPSWSLQHIVLKSMAVRWQWHVEYDHSYLAQLPVRLKELLLSYISIYNDGSGPGPLHVLFLSDINSEDNHQVQRLDLGNAIGNGSTVKKIERELHVVTERSNLPVIRPEMCEEDHEIPETWEDKECSQDTDVPSLASGITSRPQFRNLKHLSLAASPNTPRSSASWQDLLGLAGKLPTLASLSLAFWPAPTYTPYASTGRFKVNTIHSGSRPSTVYGGSSFYTAFDNDWREAAGILRSLSRNLYCLEWLDLTGCTEWAPALVWKPEDSDEDSPISIGPDWNGSWRGLDQIILAIGWLPGNSLAEHRMLVPSVVTAANTEIVNARATTATERTAGMLSRLATLRLGKQEMTSVPQSEAWDNEEERAKYRYRKEVERCVQCLNCAKEVAQRLRIVRKASGGKWLNVDLGQEEELLDL